MEKKVLFTASTYSHILNFHLPYLQWFRSQGWTVHAACGGPHAAVPYADETLDLPFKKSMGAPENLQAAAMLRRKMRAESYTLVSTHTSLAAFFTRAALAGLRQRPYTANMVHGYLFDDRTDWARRRLLLGAEQAAAPLTDLVLTMNQWDYALARRYRLGRQVVHIPGVGVDFAGRTAGPRRSRQELRAAWGIAPHAFLLLYPAEFSKRKSQAVLIRAMTRLPEEAVLALPGSGALLEECRALAGRLGVAGRVLFPGYVQDVASWQAAADAVVSSSRIEGQPFHLMEAMYAGLPIAASDIKGHRDLLEDEGCGLLYPYGDDEACAERILRLMASEDLRQRLARRGQERAAQFSIERVKPLVLRQYSAVLSEELATAQV